MHMNAHTTRLCPKGYFGLSVDPYDCSAYYMCPHQIQLFCEPNHEFDLDTASCRPIEFNGDGCTAKLYRNLLL
jgi:hypothetical protein